jgi:hypothetical protein
MPLYPGNRVISCNWAARPSAAAAGVGAQIIALDVGANGNTPFTSDGSNWWLAAPGATLFVSNTLVSGLDTTGETIVYTTPGIQRSILAACRRYSLSFIANKSGTAKTFTINIREGHAGTIADPLVYGSSGPLNTAANRMGQGGVFRRWDAANVRTVAASIQNSALENVINHGGPSPILTNSLPNDALVYHHLTSAQNSPPGEFVTCDTFRIIGY